MEKILAIFTYVLAVTSAEPVKHFVDMNPEIHPDLAQYGLEIRANIGQFMEVTCPQYDQATPAEDMLQFYLYQMKDKKYFDTCDISDNMMILSCDSPYRTTKLTMKFQKTSPYPLGFTFEDGRTYYYIAIPKGEKSCSNAMRLKVSIEKDKEVVVPPVIKPPKKTPRPTPAKTTSTFTTTTTTTTTTTIAKLTTRKPMPTTVKNKPENPKKQTGDDPGNGASSTRNFAVLTWLLFFLTLRINA